jgi:hypothetical protein
MPRSPQRGSVTRLHHAASIAAFKNGFSYGAVAIRSAIATYASVPIAIRALDHNRNHATSSIGCFVAASALEQQEDVPSREPRLARRMRGEQPSQHGNGGRELAPAEDIADAPEVAVAVEELGLVQRASFRRACIRRDLELGKNRGVVLGGHRSERCFPLRIERPVSPLVYGVDNLIDVHVHRV